MRFASLALAAVAGLWQHSLAPEETITSTRHVHVTRTVTNGAHTIYAVRVGSSTAFMEYLPASLITRTAPSATPSTCQLVLRDDTTSTMHVKLTETVESVATTLFVSKVGTSVSTMTRVPQSLIEEAAEDAAAESSSQLAAISSAQAEALAHSTVAVLASITGSAVQTPDVSNATPFPGFANLTSIATEVQSPVPVVGSSSSSTSIPPIGLELRSDADATSSTVEQASSTETPVTVVTVVYGTSTSLTTSASPSWISQIAASQAPQSTSTSSSQSSASIAAVYTSSTSAQTSVDPMLLSTNNAEMKSSQTALIQAPVYSDEASSSTSTKKGCFGNCDPTTSPSSESSTSSAASTTYTSGSMTIVLISSHTQAALSSKFYTVPVTTTTSSSLQTSTRIPASSATESTDSTSDYTAYGSVSSASAAAQIAADNAAGASGGDGGSFKLSKSGFAAIISVVCVGVGLGIIFLVLFVVAKRRQWNVRKSLARASRRLTGRFSSHPNPRARVVNEKEPSLPVIEPRVPNGPRPLQLSSRVGAARGAAAAGFAGIDAQLHSNYRGVQTAPTTAVRNPQAWRRDMAMQGRNNRGSVGMVAGMGKKKPELRVDTNLAREVEEGRARGVKVPRKGDWRELFRNL